MISEEEAQALRRENDYLKARNAQLQGDLTDLSAQVQRLERMLERTGLNRAPRTPDEDA